MEQSTPQKEPFEEINISKEDFESLLELSRKLREESIRLKKQATEAGERAEFAFNHAQITQSILYNKENKK